jgi:hypothetical protein
VQLKCDLDAVRPLHPLICAVPVEQVQRSVGTWPKPYSDTVHLRRMSMSGHMMQALVNLGNCKFERASCAADEGTREELFLEARGLYEAAARHEPDCLEAIYNIGLAAKAAQQFDVALEQFILINGLLPNQVRDCGRRGESACRTRSKQQRWLALAQACECEQPSTPRESTSHPIQNCA